MENNLLSGISLTAAFIGGNLALFAPCCITFLFPAYIGTVFKERKKVVLLTLVFGFGLSSILIPVALGFKSIIFIFDKYHTTTYLLGAFIMIVLGFLTLLETKISLPIPRYQMPKKMTISSTFILGVFSGITSSCCAPVLFAAITLSSLTPSLIGSLIVSVAYVAGIVFPLFFMSIIFDKLTQKKLFDVKRLIYKPLKLVGSLIFIISGIVIAILSLMGKINMNPANESYSNNLREFIYSISGKIPSTYTDFIIFILLIFLIFKVKNWIGKI